jgi:hypothetical protein
VHLDARWYNPHSSRFQQPDYWNLRNTHLPTAIQHELMRFTGLNTAQLLNDPSQQLAYGYVSGNPLGFVDPLGLCSPEFYGKEPINSYSSAGTVIEINYDGTVSQNGVDTYKAAEIAGVTPYAIDTIAKRIDLTLDGQICAGPCLGGELDLTTEHGRSISIKSGFGIEASAGVGSDVTLYSSGEAPIKGTLSTVNYGSAILGPVGVTYTNFAWRSDSINVFEVNFRFPGGVGINVGTGVKKW